ncbi:MAG: TRIC cation channel family protein [Anaerolineae bacterium]|nr:TRIC cation channel family protein [Anaerolineae bacterium]
MDLVTIFSYFGTWTIGSLTAIDLIAATTNAFNGALLARRKDHYRHWTVVGIVLIAILGGIGGGVARDVLLNDIPAALTNPWYLILSTLAAIVALRIAFTTGQKFREGLFQFMTAFALPWYAIIGAQKALNAGLPVIAVVLIGIIGPTAGRYFIDITAGVPPKHFIKGEWFVGTAALASVLYVALYALGVQFYAATLITFLVAFGVRLLALFRGWEEPEPPDTPDDLLAGGKPRPLLGDAIREELNPEEK